MFKRLLLICLFCLSSSLSAKFKKAEVQDMSWVREDVAMYLNSKVEWKSKTYMTGCAENVGCVKLNEFLNELSLWQAEMAKIYWQDNFYTVYYPVIYVKEAF